MSPIKRQAFTWTNAHLLSFGPLEKQYIEIWVKSKQFPVKKCIWNCRQQNDHFVEVSASKNDTTREHKQDAVLSKFEREACVGLSEKWFILPL